MVYLLPGKIINLHREVLVLSYLFDFQ